MAPSDGNRLIHMLALDWIDALLILTAIYGLVGIDAWLFGDPEDLVLTEILVWPAMLVGPAVRRLALGVPTRHVEQGFSTSGMFATLAIVFGTLIAAVGGWILYARTSAEPPVLEIPERDEFAEEWNADMAEMLTDMDAEEVDPASLPEGVVVETIDLTATPRTPQQLEAEARAEHAEDMERFREHRMDGIITALKVGGAGLLLLVLGGVLDRRRELVEPPTPSVPPRT